MWNTSGMTSVKQIQKFISDLELMILKEGLKMHRIKTKLKKSRKEGGAILKEMGEIEFLMVELQKNLLSMQSEQSRSLHEERIADLKLRKMTLEHRKPFYAPSEYDMAEKEIKDCEKIIDVWKEGVIAYQKRIEELQNAEKKSTGGGQSAQ